jgi:hypothetical protein
MRTRSFRLQIANIAADTLAGCSVARASDAVDLPHGTTFSFMLGDPRASRPCRTRRSGPRLTGSRSTASPATLQAMVERMFSAPREVVEAARQAIGQG